MNLVSAIAVTVVLLVAIGGIAGWLAGSVLQRVAAARQRPVRFLVPTAIVLTLLAGGLAIARTGRYVGVFGEGTEECTSLTVPDSTGLAAYDRTALLACAGNLAFNDDVHGSGDTQFLDTAAVSQGGGTVAAPGGPLATIIPQSSVHRNSEAALASGRIVAKVWVDTLSSGYSKLGFGPGWNYIWIDGTTPPDGNPRRPVPPTARHPRFGLEGPAQRGRYRAVIFPTDLNFPVVARPVDYYSHVDPPGKPWFRGWNMALARWTYWPDDGDAWMNCTTHGCCDVGEGFN